jgi:hypothetical protein
MQQEAVARFSLAVPQHSNPWATLQAADLQIQEFLGRDFLEYAILSHTWGEVEVTLQDLQCEHGRKKKSYAKIVGCCNKAAEDAYEYCWIDTCYIDKTSSTELSEAINSMYQWYQDSSVRYAYLADVKTEDPVEFSKSRCTKQPFS